VLALRGSKVIGCVIGVPNQAGYCAMFTASAAEKEVKIGG